MTYHPFTPTRWTLVLSTKDDEESGPSEALQHLALAYWKPVYAYQRGNRRSHEEAQDDTQGFFAYLLAREFLKKVGAVAISSSSCCVAG
ncbi:MAG: hypothetical protein ACI8T1_003318 [Verrucomicrobiales bacterium]|jgi:hypothetical protein